MSDSSFDSDWEMEYEEDESPSPSLRRQNSYEIIPLDQLENKLNQTVEEYSELLGISQDEALILLQFYMWKVHKLQDDWLDNELKVRVEAGISLPCDNFDYEKSRGVKLGAIKLIQGYEGACPICYELKESKDALQCSHGFCNKCWGLYIDNLVLSNTVIGSRCPMHSCTLALPETMILKHITSDNLWIYKRLKCENFAHQNPVYKFCPAPGCNYVAEYPNLGLHEIECKCGLVFCFSCGEEAHRPAPCSLVKEWKVKNSNESENITWILANTKECPKCKKPIEKNQGCNHMTCRKEAGGCGFEFCWLCQGPWADHNSATGGFYRCNKYEEQMNNEQSKLSKEEKKRADIKTELNKYMWYFERFNNHEKAQRIASQEQLGAMEEKMQLLHDMKNYPIGEVEFLKLGAEQVITCRRVLKWTYAFGYYLESGPEKNLFEHLQEKLEENTEHLHELVEKPLDPFLDPEVLDKSPFYQYKSDLTNYTQVTKKFLENLLEGIENGLTS